MPIAINDSDASDVKLILSASQAARVLSVGSSWSRLRIGWRMCVPDLGANIPAPVNFYAGLMASPSAGVANGPIGNSTSHFVGLRSGSSTDTWNRYTDHYRGNSGNSLGGEAIVKVGSTITQGTGNLLLGRVPHTKGNVRWPYILEVQKGTPYTISFVSPGMNSSGMWSSYGDVSYATLNTAMGLASMDGVLSYLNTEVTDKWSDTLTVDEATNGALNAAVIGFELGATSIRISELLYSYWI